MRKKDSEGEPIAALRKVKTHIEGLDLITDGGLPERRATMVSGTSGSAKTIPGIQYIVNGILVGTPIQLVAGETKRLEEMFDGSMQVRRRRLGG